MRHALNSHPICLFREVFVNSRVNLSLGGINHVSWLFIACTMDGIFANLVWGYCDWFLSCVDLYQANNEGVTALFMAAQKGFADIVETLLKHEASVDKAQLHAHNHLFGFIGVVARFLSPP